MDFLLSVQLHFTIDLKNIVYAKRKSYLDIEMENISITDTEFIQEYMGAALFVLIILFFGWVKEVFSFQMISNYVILMVFIFAPAYGAWKKDMKKAGIKAFANRSQQIIADFIYDKMREDVLNSRFGIDFEKRFNFIVLPSMKYPETFMSMYMMIALSESPKREMNPLCVKEGSQQNLHSDFVF